MSRKIEKWKAHAAVYVSSAENVQVRDETHCSFLSPIAPIIGAGFENPAMAVFDICIPRTLVQMLYEYLRIITSML